ncbi:Tyrosine kinase specific for activated [Ceratobasidium sp. AG-Ba]|nr:Tyrosine kinase specific for activated [Ceratobasidium sp. AG-Ba]
MPFCYTGGERLELGAGEDLTLITIDVNTPLPTVVDYLASHSKIPNLTEQLSDASTRTLSVAARTGLSDIYCLALSDGMQVAVKSYDSRAERMVEAEAQERAWTIWNGMIQGLFGDGVAVDDVRKRQLGVEKMAGKESTSLGGFEYLHEENVVHGDIKGDNLVMDQDGTIKLTDFGLSITDEAVFQFSQTDPGGGTTRWMAPELFGDGPQRSRETDIYAMGMTILEIITGDVPFREIKSGHSIIWAVRQERRTPQVPELEHNSASGQDMILLGVLKWCWKYNPAERPTARQVAYMLQGLVEK